MDSLFALIESPSQACMDKVVSCWHLTKTQEIENIAACSYHLLKQK